MHDLDSIFRACTIIERFGVIGCKLIQKHVKKIQKDLKKIKYAKPLLHWILLCFVDLMLSLQSQEHKPNRATL